MKSEKPDVQQATYYTVATVSGETSTKQIVFYYTEERTRLSSRGLPQLDIVTKT